MKKLIVILLLIVCTISCKKDENKKKKHGEVCFNNLVIMPFTTQGNSYLAVAFYQNGVQSDYRTDHIYYGETTCHSLLEEGVYDYDVVGPRLKARIQTGTITIKEGKTVTIICDTTIN